MRGSLLHDPASPAASSAVVRHAPGRRGAAVRAPAVAAPPSPSTLPSSPWPLSEPVPGAQPQVHKRGFTQAPPHGRTADKKPWDRSGSDAERHAMNRERRMAPALGWTWTATPDAQTGLSVTWLGTSSGSPTGHRNVSCTVVQMPHAVFLVDCGEGSHRQLQQADVDLSKVEGIFLTHLHGDHCFGLATTLQLIDNAKAAKAAAAAAAAAAAPPAKSERQSRPKTSSPGAAAALPAAAAQAPGLASMVTRVYGPPGVAELLRACLALTGEEHLLHTQVLVTELVLDAGPAAAGAQLARDGQTSLAGASVVKAGSDSLEVQRFTRGSSSSSIGKSKGGDKKHDSDEGGVRGAAWDVQATSSGAGTSAGNSVSGSSSSTNSSSTQQLAAAASRDVGPSLRICWQRLGSRSVEDAPDLKDAAQRVRQYTSTNKVPTIWYPPKRQWRPDASPGGNGNGTFSGSEEEEDASHVEYGGKFYVAAPGRYWELPCGETGAARVRAAQLQHRVPCWGYVFEELLEAGDDGNDIGRVGGQLQRQWGEGASGSGAGGRADAAQQPRQHQQQGAGPSTSGRVAPQAEASGKKLVGRKVAILGDTIASHPVAPLALDCDVISHEATFTAGMEDKCRIAQHSTGYLAGSFARCVGAKHLVLTHFSGRYKPAWAVSKARPGRPGTYRERPESEESMQHEQDEAVRNLIQEARAQFGKGRISAARDFFRVNVCTDNQAEGASW